MTPSDTGELEQTDSAATAAPAADARAQRSSHWLQAGRRTPLPRSFSIRIIFLRFVVNAVALAVTVLVTPDIGFAGNYRILTWLVISALFGLLNAFVKPLVQVVMLPLMFVSYGLVVLAINAIMFWILDVLTPTRFHTGHLLWVLLGGLIFSLVSGFLENLLGLTPPIFEGEPEELHNAIERHRHGMVEKQIRAAAGVSRPGAPAEVPAEVPAEASAGEPLPAPPDDGAVAPEPGEEATLVAPSPGAGQAAEAEDTQLMHLGETTLDPSASHHADAPPAEETETPGSGDGPPPPAAETDAGEGWVTEDDR